MMNPNIHGAPPEDYWYLHVARATDLTGSKRILYRAFEILPGFLSITTLALFVLLSFSQPVFAAYLTIVFAAYWLFKTAYLSMHLRHNFKRLRHNMSIDWMALLHDKPHDHLVHVVMVPFYDEGYEILSESVRSYLTGTWDPKKIILVLASEERSPNGKEVGERIRREFGEKFLECIVTVHPAGLPGDIPGKGSNLSFAAEQLRTHVLDVRGIRYEDAIVSAFDSDTVVYPQYFACLTWHVVTCENLARSSFQPVPLFNNNIWQAPMLSRVMAYSSSFWQMIQQERPEKLATFSSHAVPFKTLYDADYWQRNVVSEDSRIFWNLFARFDGDYRVIPIAYPVSMDANAAGSLWQTIKNIYKQHRRWTYGAENIAYILFACVNNPRIPFRKKLRASVVQIEGFWSLVTHPLVLFAVGWLPLFIGGAAFHSTVFSYNLPLIARGFLTTSMLGLIVSAAITLHLIPEKPEYVPRFRRTTMVIQWLLVPLTMVVFSSIPGLESQIRLMFGRYLGFWVTPKSRTHD